MDTELIIISIALGVSCLLLIIRLAMNLSGRKLESYIQKNFDKNEIIGATTRANFVGRKSDGIKQIRGNGALIITKKMLTFVRIMPFKEYRIKINEVEKISLPRSFMGKSVMAKLLCIHFSSHGGNDEIALAITNPEAWKKSIESLTAHAKSSNNKQES